MIDSQFVQSAVLDIGKSIAGVGISRALKLPEKLDMGDSFVMRNGSNGAVAFFTSDVIDGVTGMGSKLLNQDFIGAVDELLFFSAISAGAELLGLDNGLYDVVRKQLNLNKDMAETVTESVILSGSRVASRYLQSRSEVPAYLKSIRHPVRTLMNGQ